MAIATLHRIRARILSQAKLSVFLGVITLALTAPTATAQVYSTYSIGLDFTTTGYHYLDPWIDEMVTPYSLTNPASNFVTGGGLVGWSEADARRAILLAVEDSFRAVDTGDANRTLDVRVFDGLVPTSVPGRRLNILIGASEPGTWDLGVSIRDSADNPNYKADDAYAALVYLNNISNLQGVTYSTPDQVFNSIAGTTAHEMAHLFNLRHVDADTTQPYPIMATNADGLTNQGRLTVRRFETTPGTQAGGESSASLLQTMIGTANKADVNRDGLVSLLDGSIILSNWQATGRLTHEGDATGDHIVNLQDGSMLLANWQAAGDTAVGTGLGSIAADGSIQLDLKGLGLYEVFVGDANHNAVSGTNFLSLDSGMSDQLDLGGALENNIDGVSEGFGALDLGLMISTATPILDGNSSFLGWSDSTARDTFVNVDLAGLQAAGYGLWLKTQTSGDAVYVNLVPEPATMALLALGGLVLARRRARLA